MHNNSLTIPVKVRVGGIFTLQVYRDGKLRQTVGPFDNLVLNQGLDILCGGIPTGALNASVMTYVDVGTGTNTPTITDTTLQAPLGNYQADTSFSEATYVAGPPAYHTVTGVYTYPLGALVGNISEIGVGGGVPSGGAPTRPFYLFSRALIVDGGGSPTVISLTSADQLVVTYEVRRYLDLTTNTGSIVISGVTYATQTQIYSVNTNITSPAYIVSANIRYFGSYTTQTLVAPTSTSISGSGSSRTSSNFIFDPYSLGSFFRTCYATISPSGWTSSIGSISLTLWGSWQIAMTPVIPKTADNALTLHFSFSFTQYP